jgi:hypothetical protein
LGIGLQDNVEIGSERAVLLTLAALGYETMPVHIPKSNESDFKHFRADVSLDKMNTSSQSGNALIYILIAVALLGALSFAVSQSGRGNIRQLSAEKAKITSNEIIEYGNVLANAVAQLRLRGCADTELSFQNPETALNVNASAPADKTCHIFDPAGGGVTYRAFPEFDAAGPKFNTGTEGIEQTGTDSGADLWMRLDSAAPSGGSMAKVICAQINDALNFTPVDDTTTDGFEPTIDGDWADTEFVGVYPSASAEDYTILNGMNAFCVGHNTDEVSYFRLLLSR